MQLLSFGPERATPISEYLSQHASAIALASGHGEARVYCLHLDAGGEIEHLKPVSLSYCS
jgi:hypothetical protein